jgi:hypothetical protein
LELGVVKASNDPEGAFFEANIARFIGIGIVGVDQFNMPVGIRVVGIIALRN